MQYPSTAHGHRSIWITVIITHHMSGTTQIQINLLFHPRSLTMLKRVIHTGSPLPALLASQHDFEYWKISTFLRLSTEFSTSEKILALSFKGFNLVKCYSYWIAIWAYRVQWKCVEYVACVDVSLAFLKYCWGEKEFILVWLLSLHKFLVAELETLREKSRGPHNDDERGFHIEDGKLMQIWCSMWECS